jgi:hypothetical protein
LILVTFGCSTATPRQSLQERQSQRGEQFAREAKDDTIIAAWNLKENLKKDYAEIIGPSKAYDEKMDLQFENAMSEAMLATPGQYERMVQRWKETRTDAPPTRDEVKRTIEVLDGRSRTLDTVIAQEVLLAEQQAKEDAERQKRIIQVIAGIALVGFAVAAGATATAANTPASNSTGIGPYVITRTSPTTANILTPAGRLYTCTTTGGKVVSVVNCFTTAKP